MSLQELKVSQFRNLSSVSLRPGAYLNFIYGVNGSGKTSLLEAISVLAHGRSFRTRKYRRLIQQDADEFTVFGLVDTKSKPAVAVGVARQRSGVSQFKVDGAAVRSATELASLLPVLVINADSFGLLTGAPQQRRQFFDWLVFHVKPSFRNNWRDYNRCLKQRNSLLRHDKISYSDVHHWDVEISRLAQALESDRLACIEPFLIEFKRLISELDFTIGDSTLVTYSNGWKSDEPYEQQLADAFQRDRKRGYTSLGPHKSDLKVITSGVPAGEILSRGQQKAMVSAMYVAEARVFQSQFEQGCMFLIDDMPAELDAANIRRVGRWINGTASQAYITSVEFTPMRELWPEIDAKDPKVFHVEHGEVEEQSIA